MTRGEPFAYERVVAQRAFRLAGPDGLAGATSELKHAGNSLLYQFFR